VDNVRFLLKSERKTSNGAGDSDAGIDHAPTRVSGSPMLLTKEEGDGTPVLYGISTPFSFGQRNVTGLAHLPEGIEMGEARR